MPRAWCRPVSTQCSVVSTVSTPASTPRARGDRPARASPPSSGSSFRRRRRAATPAVLVSSRSPRAAVAVRPTSSPTPSPELSTRLALPVGRDRGRPGATRAVADHAAVPRSHRGGPGPPAYRLRRCGRRTSQTSEVRCIYVWLDGDNVRQPSFERCAMCQPTGPARARIFDFRTRGEQPFTALIEAQFAEQPPQKLDPRLPNHGRKVLVFSDGRQKAARLAPALEHSHARDLFRQVIALAASELREQDESNGYAVAVPRRGLALRQPWLRPLPVDRRGRISQPPAARPRARASRRPSVSPTAAGCGRPVLCAGPLQRADRPLLLAAVLGARHGRGEPGPRPRLRRLPGGRPRPRRSRRRCSGPGSGCTWSGGASGPTAPRSATWERDGRARSASTPRGWSTSCRTVSRSTCRRCSRTTARPRHWWLPGSSGWCGTRTCSTSRATSTTCGRSASV